MTLYEWIAAIFFNPWKKGWKVLRTNRESYFRGGSIGSCVYHIETATYPQPSCGPLCVFRTKRLATKFVNYMNWEPALVVPCIYTPSKSTNVWDTIIRRDINEKFPRGTKLADKVICLE